MNKFYLLFAAAVLFSCRMTKGVNSTYYFVEPFKEQEVMLFINNDSTFKVEDSIGCNQFKFVGIYRKLKNDNISYLVFDSVRFQSLLTNADQSLFFQIENKDTAWIINKDRIFIHNKPFALLLRKKTNLQEIRYKKLRDYYIELLGKGGFILTFGEGKGMKEAKKRLLDCTLPDIKILDSVNKGR
jgi:hypothetical protein